MNHEDLRAASEDVRADCRNGQLTVVESIASKHCALAEGYGLFPSTNLRQLTTACTCFREFDALLGLCGHLYTDSTHTDK